MALPLVLILGMMIFVFQLMLCLKSRKRWCRVFPLVLMLVGQLLCAGVILLEKYILLPDGASFAASIYAILLLLFTAVDLLAWLCYRLGKWFRRIRLRRAGK